MASFFVNRPIVAMVLSILMVLLGAVAMTSLPISQYPEITPPEILVEATYTGASAVDVEQSVATPVEQQVNGVENMIYMKSTNASDGKMQLRVSFDVGTDLDIANVLTQNRVTQANPSLPEEVKRLGVSVKKSLAFPLLLVTLTSPNGSYDSGFLSNYASINIIDAIARIRGVGLVNQFGGSDYAMRIWIRPDRLAQLGPDDARHARTRSSSRTCIAAAGQIGGAAGARGDRVHLHRQDGRAAPDAGGVRRGRAALEPGRLAGPAEGRRADRAGRPDLRHDGPAQRQARGRAGDLPDPGLERARGRRRRSGRRWTSCRSASPRISSTRSRSTRRCR